MIPIINSLGNCETKFINYWSQDSYFWNPDDPYDDLIYIIYGPRGGGKTTAGIWLSIVDGQWRGIPTISNVPFRWIAVDKNNHYYSVNHIPFDINLFAHGDQFLKYKRLYIDEGNYELDRLRSTSNKNLAMTDILQQARKLRMSVVFSTINWAWLDPKLTGSLCDITIECQDLHFKPYGRKHKIGKGVRSTWDVKDQSGKYSGHQYTNLAAITFYNKVMWGVFDTENFVDPTEARRAVRYSNPPIMIGQDGQTYDKGEWLAEKRRQLVSLYEANPGRWDDEELWQALGVENEGQRMTLGRMFSKWGVRKHQTVDGYKYNLEGMAVLA